MTCVMNTIVVIDYNEPMGKDCFSKWCIVQVVFKIIF